MDRTIGQITGLVVLVAALASGAIAINLEAVASIVLGGWNGFMRAGEEAEGIVCDARGDCEFRPGVTPSDD